MIRATKTQIEDFRESLLWKDIVDEITSWKTQATNEYDSLTDEVRVDKLSTAGALTHLGHIAGRKMAVDYFLGILDSLLSMKENESEEEE